VRIFGAEWRRQDVDDERAARFCAADERRCLSVRRKRPAADRAPANRLSPRAHLLLQISYSGGTAVILREDLPDAESANRRSYRPGAEAGGVARGADATDPDVFERHATAGGTGSGAD